MLNFWRFYYKTPFYTMRRRRTDLLHNSTLQVRSEPLRCARCRPTSDCRSFVTRVLLLIHSDVAKEVR